MSWLRVEPPFEKLFREHGLDSFTRIAQHFISEGVQRDQIVVQPARVGSVDVYFKLYQYASPCWRFWMRASKARREFDNYEQLRAIGVPVATRVAAGEDRDLLGRLKAAFIITVAVPGARTLTDFFRAEPSLAERRGVCADVAQAARLMHLARFYHHDLVWRNVLVNDAGNIVFIDCPRGAVTRTEHDRKRLRDLASLDKSASKFLRRAERLRLLLNYLGKTRLDSEARELIRDCLEYRRTRWPEDWTGK